MTPIFREPNLLDKFLLLFGKKRAYKIPGSGIADKPYCYGTMQPENFFRALIRPANTPLPSGLVYRDRFSDSDEELKESKSLKTKG